MFYQVVAGIYDLEGTRYISYGIRFLDTAIEDISMDKEAVMRLVSLCNEQVLDPIHIYDVIEDFLLSV